MTADEGTVITWSVSKEGYVTQSGTYTLTADKTETVTLLPVQYTFEIEATPADATVTINGEERTTLTADVNTAITWSVAKTGYVTQNGTYTLVEDKTETVTLSPVQYTFTISATPADATVTINGTEQTSLTADVNTEITWSVAAEGYTTQTGTHTLVADYTETVTLVEV